MTTKSGRVQRPGPVRWLRYAYGAGLPERFDEWVLKDTTSPTWVLRQIGRALVQLAPLVVAVLVAIPGPFWIRAVAVVAATAMALLFSLAYMIETTDRRLTKAGYASGTAEAVRHERSTTARLAATAQRRVKLAARQARRRARAA
jgi:hypothetical protein